MRKRTRWCVLAGLVGITTMAAGGTGVGRLPPEPTRPPSTELMVVDSALAEAAYDLELQLSHYMRNHIPGKDVHLRSNNTNKTYEPVDSLVDRYRDLRTRWQELASDSAQLAQTAIASQEPVDPHKQKRDLYSSLLVAGYVLTAISGAVGIGALD